MEGRRAGGGSGGCGHRPTLQSRRRIGWTRGREHLQAGDQASSTGTTAANLMGADIMEGSQWPSLCGFL